MTFHYKVTDTQYITMLESILKRQETSPIRLIALFFLTIGQTLWVIYMISTANLSDHQKIFMVTWSVILFGINIIYRLGRHRRAVKMFRRLQAQQQIDPTYWGTHTLRIDSGEARLSFGTTHLQCRCSEITVVQLKGLILLNSRNKVFDIIPCESEQERHALLQVLSREAQYFQNAPDSSLDENQDAFLRYDMTGKEFVNGQVLIYQYIYLTQTAVRPMTMIKLLASLFLIYYAATMPFGISSVLLIGICCMWNLPLFLCIPPLTRRYLLTKILELQHCTPEELLHFQLRISGENIVVKYADEQFTFSSRHAQMLQNTHKGILMFTGTWPALMIPASAFESRREQDAFFASLRSTYIQQ